MPWTFAHPLAILPIHRIVRRRLSFMALVIGSISPDLGYYVSAFDLASLAHKWTGLFLVCLPLGWCVFLFMRVMRQHFIYLLPQLQRQALQAHIAVPQELAPVQIAWISLTLMLGATTHIVWDAFTHASGFAVKYFTVLRTPLHIGDFNIPAFHLLQHGSTLVGSLLLTYFYWKWLKHLPHVVILEPRENDQWRYALLAGTATTALVLAIPVAFAMSGVPNQDGANEGVVFHMVLGFTTCFALMWTMAAMLIARARGFDQAAD